MRAGCVFVAGIHPSRTWTSGSFESVQWNACMHRLDLGLYSHPKEFLGEWSLTPCLTPREKSFLPENVPRGGSNPRHCGQRAQALPTELFRPPTSDFEIGTPVATLPGAWRYRVSAGAGRPWVSIQWLGEVESGICNFCLSVAACKIVWADLSLKYTSLLLGC